MIHIKETKIKQLLYGIHRFEIWVLWCFISFWENVYISIGKIHVSWWRAKAYFKQLCIHWKAKSLLSHGLQLQWGVLKHYLEVKSSAVSACLLINPDYFSKFDFRKDFAPIYSKFGRSWVKWRHKMTPHFFLLMMMLLRSNWIIFHHSKHGQLLTPWDGKKLALELFYVVKTPTVAPGCPNFLHPVSVVKKAEFKSVGHSAT